MTHVTRRLLATFGAGALLATALAGPAHAAPAPRLETVELDVEESRLPAALPGASEAFSARMIAYTGLAPALDTFAASLAETAATDAKGLVVDTGRQLWNLALQRAQDPEATALYEDRGLYWARLAMRAEVKAWAETSGVDDQQLTDLLHRLEESTRGLLELGFDEDPDVTKVMISGFDPFQLDALLERSNPSGAAALSLSGRVIETESGPVQIQAVVLPVTWSRFDGGIVEDAYGPQLLAGAASPQMAMTISQGRTGYDVERWASIWRGGGLDNLNESALEEAPDAAAWPQTVDGAQFIETTLPFEEMVAAETGPFPVQLNNAHCFTFDETRQDEAQCVETADPTAPPEGSFAVSGGGGDYLSNESMYRANRLRVALDRDDVAGGHLHVPVLDYENLAADRATNVEQTQRLILAAAAALPAPLVPEPEPTPAPEPTDEPTDEPTVEPTAEPTPDETATPAPAVPAPDDAAPVDTDADESLPATGSAVSPPLVLAAAAAALLGGLVLLLRRRRAQS
jgi:LPXTG-motif cell wall-anchored protein